MQTDVSGAVSTRNNVNSKQGIFCDEIPKGVKTSEARKLKRRSNPKATKRREHPLAPREVTKCDAFLEEL